MRARSIAGALAAAVLLATPGAAGAAFTASTNGGNGTLTGSDAAETLVISQSGGQLTHGRQTAGDPGFSSDLDWNTALAGDQTIAAGAMVTVNFAGGNDVLAPSGTAPSQVVANGGAGDDTLDGSIGPDNLRGGSGDDRITPDNGADNAFGDDGDDALVWTNGDGTDTFDGGPGFDTAEVDTAAANDTMTVAAGGGGTTVSRDAPGAFTVTALTEAVDLSTFGGDDTVNVNGTPPSAVSVDAGSGGDKLNGGGGAETLFGGSGNDAVTGGAGSDVLDGASGDDSITARDSAADQVRCGPGLDAAVLDPVGVDTATDCDIVDQPPAPATTPTPTPTTPAPQPAPPVVAPPPAGRLVIAANQRLTARSGAVSLAVSCPAGTAGCRGEVTLVTRSAVRIGAVRAVAQVGRASYSLAAGRRGTLRLRLPRRFERLAGRRARQLRVNALVSGADGAVRGVPVTLRARA